MTLIIGILCSDGAVVASDGAATLGAPGNPTVRQEVRKLDVINDKIIVGVSGPVGLGQKIKHTIKEQWDSNQFAGINDVQACTKLSEGITQHLVPLFQTAQHAVPVVGQPLASLPVMSASIVAMIIQHKPALIQFDFEGASELATEDIPFIAVGSGQQLADPFLAFLRRLFWKDHLPTLTEGTFAAVWTLQHAIEVHPGGVSKPIQVAQLKNDDGGVAVELEESEYQEHYDAIKAAEDKLSNFREDIVTSSIAEAVPEPES